jgi:Ca2+-binding RTX toxin-like protein
MRARVYNGTQCAQEWEETPMATFTVNTAAGFDLLSIDLFDLFDYPIETKAATAYRLSADAANFTLFTGTGFAYAPTTPSVLTAGTVTAFSRTDGGTKLYTFGALSLPASTFETFRESGDTSGFLKNLLGGNDTINGGTGNDTLFGFGGNDRLDGKAGADIMYGGAGNDTYVVDNVGDVVSEDGFGVFSGEGTDTIETAVSFVLPILIENLTLTGTAHINAMGSLGANTIKGNAGNNVIDGRFGADNMQGGAGNDTYYVDDDGDVVSDAAGVDAVFSQATTHTMGAGVENGTMLAGGTLKGNSLANTLAGNDLDNVMSGEAGNDIVNGLGGFDQLNGGSGNDTLDGGAGPDLLGGGSGNDTLIGGLGDDLIDVFGAGIEAIGADKMSGGLGNDSYLVDNIGDVITELAGEGYDVVAAKISYVMAANVEQAVLYSLSGNLNLTGNALANKMTGTQGDNTLDGMGGADVMSGGQGNDTYVVDNAADKIFEDELAGTDLAKASVSYRLALYVDNLTLTGVADIDGTGNSEANTLIGNSGQNVLDGRGGADDMKGGAGNDTYIVDHGSDTATDTGGVDLVESSVTFLMGTGIDNLVLTGSSLISGMGNSLNNVMTGNGAGNDLAGGGGNDTLDGKGGTDLLIGGAGADKFVFSALSPSFDAISDFQHLLDDIVVSAAAFGGGLAAGGSVAVTNAASAAGTGAQMVYDSGSGNLTWDTNGTDPGGATLFAKLSAGLTLTAADFVVIT